MQYCNIFPDENTLATVIIPSLQVINYEVFSYQYSIEKASRMQVASSFIVLAG